MLGTSCPKLNSPLKGSIDSLYCTTTSSIEADKQVVEVILKHIKPTWIISQLYCIDPY